ncbi:hypothetical protein FW774_16530 [Pedobacter sp. BS3]|uniref:hypothetical protein n=1 Tax=Pedobacter sp. BS3 TaxID=2567937 RepID=UPI0011EC3DEE|nr:hypothetical protein [Pedobacter sp. BS3]TZF82290.1 hypothetical protein FW774_16530 [Pedobacter sp. BS3]
MKSKFTYTLFLLLLITGIFYACRKEFSKPDAATLARDLADPSKPLTIATGKFYYRSLIKREGKIVPKTGNSVSSEKRVNKKYSLFSKAMQLESSRYYYLEMPIVYNQRHSLIVNENDASSANDVNQKVLRASFDRLVIYKDKQTGVVNQRIITFVPDAACIGKFSKNVKSNRTGKLDKNFSGWLVYQKWDGTKLFAIKIKNGKPAGRLTFKRVKKNTKPTKNQVKNWVCVTYHWIEYEITCFTVSAEEGDEEVCFWVPTGYEWDEESCHDDGVNENPGDPECYEDDSCGGDDCEECVSTPLLDAILKSTSSLTAAQKAKIESLLSEMKDNCVGEAIYNYMTNNSYTFNFSVNSTMSYPAAYNPSSDAITMQDPQTTSWQALEEELFHAYQNKTISGGIAQYQNQAGSANIEFESKVIRDINLLMNGYIGGLAVLGSGYTDWLSDITNGFTQFPSSYSTTMGSGYYIFMETFVQNNPGYSSTSINYQMPPQAMFQLINNSSCTH